MKIKYRLMFAMIIATTLAAALAGTHHFYTMLNKPEVNPPSSTSSDVAKAVMPGVVRFEPGASQLSYIKTVITKEAPIPVSEPFNGKISYDENFTSRLSSPIPGRVTSIHAEVGDKVARFAKLVDIDAPELASAEADWHKALAETTQKKLAFERTKNLLAHEVIARKEYEAAEADYRQAQAETQRAHLKMRSLNATGNEQGRFSLKSPITGIVADKQINPGMEVRPDLSNPLFTITDIHHLWLLVDVSERSLSRIKLNQHVSFETDAYPNEVFHGTVERIGIALDASTRRLQVRCKVNNTEEKLHPEMFAKVSFLADEKQKGIEVPNTGLIIDGIYHYAFVEKTPGVFEKRQIHVLQKGAESSFIDTGLKSNERLVVEGALLLNAEDSSHAK
ncbi:MAG: efflux RND transporter periplasmic adaptor subunit [Pseudomonadota bacterium]